MKGGIPFGADMAQINVVMKEAAGALEAVKKQEVDLSFAGQLHMVAQVLRINHMPQEAINMVLAARCGLPVQKVDLKSPCFKWVEDEPAVQQ